MNDVSDVPDARSPVVPVVVPDPRRPTRRQTLAAAAVSVPVAVAAVVLPFTAGPTFVTDITQVAAFTVAFAGLSLLTHRLGLLSLGHGALTGVGAVFALHSVNDFGLPPMLMPAVGFAAGTAVGALLGIPSLRLPQAYLALLTLSAAVAFPIVLRQIDGPLPVTLDGRFAPPAWTGIAARDEHIWEYAVVVGWAAVALVGLDRLLRGPVGRALVAAREPDAAAAFGIAVYRLRLGAVALSGGLAGLAGGLLVVPVNFTDQAQYPEVLSIKMFALAVAFGGTAGSRSALVRVLGWVGAAGVLVLLPTWLADRPGWVTQGGWIGLVKSEGFLYAALLLGAAFVVGRGRRAASGRR